MDEFCDNQLVVLAAERMKPKAEPLIVFAQERQAFAETNEARVYYVNTKENKIADWLSRYTPSQSEPENRELIKLFGDDAQSILTKRLIFGNVNRAPAPSRAPLFRDWMQEAMGGLASFLEPAKLPPTPPHSDDEDERKSEADMARGPEEPGKEAERTETAEIHADVGREDASPREPSMRREEADTFESSVTDDVEVKRSRIPNLGRGLT